MSYQDDMLLLLLQHRLPTAIRHIRNQRLELSRAAKIMIYLDNAWDYSEQSNVYKTVLAQGSLSTSDFDMMGVSHYPIYDSAAELSSLQSSLETLGAAYPGREFVVAETHWPTSSPDPA